MHNKPPWWGLVPTYEYIKLWWSKDFSAIVIPFLVRSMNLQWNRKKYSHIHWLYICTTIGKKSLIIGNCKSKVVGISKLAKDIYTNDDQSTRIHRMTEGLNAGSKDEGLGKGM